MDDPKWTTNLVLPQKRRSSQATHPTMPGRGGECTHSPPVTSREWSTIWTTCNLRSLLVLNGAVWWCWSGTLLALLCTLITVMVIITAFSVELNLQRLTRAHILHVSPGTTVTPDTVEHTLQHTAAASDALLGACERAIVTWLARPAMAQASLSVNVTVIKWRTPMSQLRRSDIPLLLADTDHVATIPDAARLRNVLQNQLRKFDVGFNRRIVMPHDDWQAAVAVVMHDAMDVVITQLCQNDRTTHHLKTRPARIHTMTRRWRIACIVGLNHGVEAILLCINAIDDRQHYVLLRATVVPSSSDHPAAAGSDTAKIKVCRNEKTA